MAHITPPAGMTECDGCGGDGHNGQDEGGGWYACYRCGTTGWMPVECQWEEPMVLAECINPRQHFMARFPPPPARYMRRHQLHYGYSNGIDDDSIPF